MTNGCHTATPRCSGSTDREQAPLGTQRTVIASPTGHAALDFRRDVVVASRDFATQFATRSVRVLGVPTVVFAVLVTL